MDTPLSVDELFRNSLPFVGPALLPAVALLLSPSLGRRGRTLWAAVLGFIAVGFIADILLFDHSHVNTLLVPNVFERGPEAEPHIWTVDEVKAPVWQWHVVVAVFMALAAIFLFVRRGRSAAPQPVAMGVGVFVYFLALRLALEKTATHVEIVWAVGPSWALLVILPFFAWHCGRGAYDFKRFLKNLVWLVLLQRLVLVATGYFATTRTLGTHLDAHLVTDVALPVAGERTLATPLEAWVWTTLVPQLTFAFVFMTVMGLVLGALPWWLARRRAHSGAAAVVGTTP